MSEEHRTGKVRRSNPDIHIENDRRARDEDGNLIEKRPQIEVDPGEPRKLNTILIILFGIALMVVIMYFYGKHESLDEYNKKLEKRIELLEKQPIKERRGAAQPPAQAPTEAPAAEGAAPSEAPAAE